MCEQAGEKGRHTSAPFENQDKDLPYASHTLFVRLQVFKSEEERVARNITALR